MTEQRLSDARLTAALAARLPERAQAGLRERIRADVATTRQQRPLPSFLAALTDADPVTRHRSLLIAAMLLLALALSAAAIVGALLNPPRQPELSLDRPADLLGFIQSAYANMPELPPLTLTAVEDGTTKTRIFVDSTGAVRIEKFGSLESVEPEAVTIYSGTSMASLISFRGQKWWYRQSEAISEDPRVFVYATLGGGGGGWASPAHRCQTVLSDPAADPSAAARDIRYVGAEYVLGRPTHRLRCVGDRWVDVETRLILRAEGPALDAAGVAIPGQTQTMEVTELSFGQPAAALFDTQAPAGVPLMSEEDYSCATDPYCLASPRPVVTPSTAPDPGQIPENLDALVAEAAEAPDDLPAFEASVVRSNTKYPGSELRVHHDGSGRYRIVETREESYGDPPSVTLVLRDSTYQSATMEDGREAWYASGRREGASDYPLPIEAGCGEGWIHGGVDLVAGRTADRVECPAQGLLYWIDRELGIVVRTQSPQDERWGTDVIEVVELRLGPQPEDLFELPAGAEIIGP